MVRFGEKYKQWNAAFDAGYAAAKAVAREPAQVVQALAYVIRGELPR